MIKIVTGKLGQGKTLYSVMEMFDDFCGGNTVCTNIAVDMEEIKCLARRSVGVEVLDSQLIQVTPEDDPNWHKSIPWGVVGKPVKVYLDEIHLFFNARDWSKTATDSKSLLKFLTQSRKAAVDITFIAQDKETIEKQFRVLAEWEYYVTSSDHIPLGPIIGPVARFLGLKCFIVVVKDAGKGTFQKRIWRKYDKRFFRLYGSFTFLDKEMNELYAGITKVAPVKLVKVGAMRRAWLNLKVPVRRAFSKVKAS